MQTNGHGHYRSRRRHRCRRRDSRVAMNLQKERAGVEIKCDMNKITEILEREGK
jgi:hypothetical protein